MGRQAGRRRRVLVVRVLLLGGLLLLPATFPAASAAFTASTAADGNSVAAAEIAAPSGFTVAQTCAPGPGITFSAVATATGSATVTVTLPATVQEYDLLLAQVAYRGRLSTISAPSGWTSLGHAESYDGVSGGTAATSAVFWRRATASEPSTATFGLSGVPSTTQVFGAVAAYRGVSRSNPINASATATGNSNAVTTPSVTTTVDNAMIVQFVTKRQEEVPAPSGTAERWSEPSGGGTAWVGATGFDELRATAGAAGGRTADLTTSTFSAEWVTHTVALRPALGIPSASLSWTASPTSSATGYALERIAGGSVQRAWTVTPISATSTTDGTLVNGTTYTYRLWAYRGSWTSPVVSANLTPAC